MNLTDLALRNQFHEGNGTKPAATPPRDAEALPLSISLRAAETLALDSPSHCVGMRIPKKYPESVIAKQTKAIKVLVMKSGSR